MAGNLGRRIELVTAVAQDQGRHQSHHQRRRNHERDQGDCRRQVVELECCGDDDAAPAASIRTCPVVVGIALPQVPETILWRVHRGLTLDRLLRCGLRVTVHRQSGLPLRELSWWGKPHSSEGLASPVPPADPGTLLARNALPSLNDCHVRSLSCPVWLTNAPHRKPRRSSTSTRRINACGSRSSGTRFWHRPLREPRYFVTPTAGCSMESRDP